jgi:hypothetical protein
VTDQLVTAPQCVVHGARFFTAAYLGGNSEKKLAKVNHGERTNRRTDGPTGIWALAAEEHRECQDSSMISPLLG